MVDYAVSYKRPGRAGLVWFNAYAVDAADASRQVRPLALERLGGNWQEYGISRGRAPNQVTRARSR